MIPDGDERAALEEERDFLLASLDDLERERAAGDVDDHDYRTLRADYTARAAAVLRALVAARHDVTALVLAERFTSDASMASALIGMTADAHPRVRFQLLATLGGLETDLSARVLSASGSPVPGLYAAGEAAGFGGGGMHGYRALEGTFLGGCLFSGRAAGHAAAMATG